MTPQEIKEKVQELSLKEEWNHFYIFPGDVKTRESHISSPGYNINKWKRLKPIIEMLQPIGKTMVDIGCSDGFFAIQSANLGMHYVLGTDIDPLRINRSNLAKKAYGLDNVEFRVQDLYDSPEDENYDIVLGLGLIHRVPDLTACLDKLAQIGDTLVLEFKTLNSEEEDVVYHGGKTKSNVYNALHYTPTQNFMIRNMSDRGFTNHKIFDDEMSNLNYKRTIMVFSKKEL